MTATPGASAAKFRKFRLFWGRYWICSGVTFVVTSGVRKSTAAAAETVTVSLTRAATLSSKSSLTIWPTRTRTFFVSVPKLGSVVVTLYGPGETAMLKNPLVSVVAAARAPLSSLIASTVAPGSAPPDSSLTLPLRVPVVVCACASGAKSAAARSTDAAVATPLRLGTMDLMGNASFRLGA